jgi:hypothetical protein
MEAYVLSESNTVERVKMTATILHFVIPERRRRRRPADGELGKVLSFEFYHHCKRKPTFTGFPLGHIDWKRRPSRRSRTEGRRRKEVQTEDESHCNAGSRPKEAKRTSLLGLPPTPRCGAALLLG